MWRLSDDEKDRILSGLTVERGSLRISFRRSDDYDVEPVVEVTGEGGINVNPDRGGLAEWLFCYDMQIAYEKAGKAMEDLKNRFEGIRIKEL